MPDAIITGKMFGNGVYFAPSSMKSWNYTSYRGTSWANGDADVAFMGLYATAYGTPKDVDIWDATTDYKKMVQAAKAKYLIQQLKEYIYETIKYFITKTLCCLITL